MKSRLVHGVLAAALACYGMMGCAANSPARTGPAAPALRVKSLEHTDRELTLADFSGKYVLVDFWATWCAPCREEVPALKETFARFGSDPRFAMLSISLDRGPTPPRQFVAGHDMRWVQGFGGSSSEQDVLREKWNIEGIPAIYLIDPNGKIIASDLRGDEIAVTVATALKRP